MYTYRVRFDRGRVLSCLAKVLCSYILTYIVYCVSTITLFIDVIVLSCELYTIFLIDGYIYFFIVFILLILEFDTLELNSK